MKRFIIWGLLLLTAKIHAGLYQPCANDIIACPPPSMYIDIQTGGYRLMAPGFSFGEILASDGSGLAAFPNLIEHHDRITGFYPRIAAGFEFDNGCLPCVVGENFFIELAVFYSCFEKVDNSNETITDGFAFPRINGEGDFLFTSELTRFSAISLRRKYEYGGFQGKLGSNIFCCSKLITITPYLELDVDSFNQTYEGTVPRINGGLSGRNFRFKEKLTTSYWDFGGGFDIFYRCSPACRTLFFFVEGTGFLSHADTEFKATERITLPPRAPIKIENDECVFSGKARGQLGVGYFFGNNVAVSIMGQIDYWGYVPRVTNPHRVEDGSGAVGIYDGPARITRTSATNYALVFDLTVAFF